MIIYLESFHLRESSWSEGRMEWDGDLPPVATTEEYVAGNGLF